MSPRAIQRRFGTLDRHRLVGRGGFVSDDTEQSALVAQSLARCPHDVPATIAAFRRSLAGWFLRLPWGIGLATLRACLRLLIGLRRTGVASAGNGAAMRSAMVGGVLLQRRIPATFNGERAGRGQPHLPARGLGNTPMALHGPITNLPRGFGAKGFSALFAMARNLALYPVILAHGFRRLIPW